MDHTVCPGSKNLKQPKPEIFTCSNCGEEVEIWTDEIKGTCLSCGKVAMRKNAMSCLEWCKMAADCVGEDTFNKYVNNKSSLLKEKLLTALENYFDKDTRRIHHAKNVLAFAEELLIETKADPFIVIPAAILHDVGIKAAEEKFGKNNGPLQEQEGPRIAKEILLKEGFEKPAIEEICRIIANHHSPENLNTKNAKILFDADCLENIKEILNKKSKEELKKTINNLFLTEEGKALAIKKYC
jgi:HD superfamily phosphodiesterase